MAGEIFDAPPARVLKADVPVMLERTSDELTAIQQLWPRFEGLVGLRGRRMYAMVEGSGGTYAACTPIKDGDDPAALGLGTAVLPGGWYLRARITGEPPGLYERIGPAMQALEKLARVDPDRPLVEYYRRHEQIELWVPVRELWAGRRGQQSAGDPVPLMVKMMSPILGYSPEEAAAQDARRRIIEFSAAHLS